LRYAGMQKKLFLIESASKKYASDLMTPMIKFVNRLKSFSRI
jgi:hypothetical protein